MKEEKLKTISFINVPSDLKMDFGSFHLDPAIKLPVQKPEGAKMLSDNDITMESIIAGMLTIIAYDENNKNFSYYRDFVNAVQPNTAEELNKAAIAKQQQKDYDFAEELFLAVYHMLPQPASCINLATLYSYMSVYEEEENKDMDKADEMMNKAKLTLLDGLRRFGENQYILSEISSFEGFLGNLDLAKDYAERYLKVADEGEKKEEMKKFLKQVNARLEADNSFKEAYDYIMLDMPEKALSVIDSFIKENSDVWNGHFLKAWALRKASRYKEAKESLLKCLELGESNGDIYNELSICELEEGNRELAKTYLNTAVDLDEDNLTAMSNLAYLHLMDGEYDEARYYLEKSRKLAHDDAILSTLIKAYEEKTGEKLGDNITEEITDNTEAMTEGDKNMKDNHGHCCHNHEHEHEDGHCCHNHEHEHEDGHCCHSHEHGHEDGHCCHNHEHRHEDGHCCHSHEHGHEEGGCCGHHGRCHHDGNAND